MTPFFEADGITIFNGDCREVMREVEPVDAIITDPPYELSFMSKKWDNTGIAFDSETWAIALRCVKPGAYLLAFGGTRTFHRLACAIEDAGWELRDTIMWVHGQGFPKSLNVRRSIDTELCTLAGRHYWTELPQGTKARQDDHICPFTSEGENHEGEGTALALPHKSKLTHKPKG